MRRVQTTAERVCRALWGCAAASVEPDEAWRGLYLDEAGPAQATCPYTGEVRRGWRVRRMTGDEPITIELDDRAVVLTGESWVVDRLGAHHTGRDGRALRELADKA